MEQGAWQQQPGAVPQLRPLDIGQKIDAAIKLTTRNFGTLATIVLVVAGPIQLLSILITLSTVPDDYTVGSGDFGGGTATPDSDTDASAGFWVGQIIVVLLGGFVYLLTTAGCFKAITSAYMGQKVNWQESLSYGLKRLPSVLWVSILVFLATMAGLLALIVGAIYLAVAFALALPALLLEDKRGTKALGRSHGLVKGRWWRTFGVLVAGYVLASVIAGIVQGILAALMFVATGDDSAISVVLSSIAGLAGQVITTPFVAALVTVVYFDLRVRKEAFDLQVIAQAIGGRPPDASATQGMPWFAPPGWGPQWGQGGYGQQPQQWGQPGGQPPGWGQPPQPGWGQPQQQQQWGQPQGQPGWGQPGQAPPPGQPPPPLQPQPSQQQPQPPVQPTQEQPQPTREQPQPEPERWEPPAPPEQPPAPPQQWEPPEPPGPPAPPPPPDPPDRSSS